MFEFIATRLLPLTASICLPVLTALLFILQYRRRTATNRLLFIAAACLLAGYLTVRASSRQTVTTIDSEGMTTTECDARPIYASNLLLSIGMIGGTIGCALKLKEKKK